MDSLDKNLFTEIINQAVSVDLPDGSGTAELIITEVESCSLNGDEWESFCVCLQGEDNCHLPQGTYQVSHAIFGTQDIFLSPKSPTDYEIIINRKKA